MKTAFSYSYYFFFLLPAFLVHAAEKVSITVETLHPDDGRPLPSRLHLMDAGNQPVHADGLPYWNDHSSSPGQAKFLLSPGAYQLTAARGPEWQTVTRAIQITSEMEGRKVKVELRRLVDLPREGWWPGETHIHRNISNAALLMQSEDLHVGEFITWWNASNPWMKNPQPSPLLKEFDKKRFVHLLAGEDERDGGALLFFNLSEPINITDGRRHYPSSLRYARKAKQEGAWIDIEKPFWWDVPMWVAHGVGDSIGIANNHMQRSGVLGNEAWGRPRDLEQFPGPQGNGWWTQEIYYHLLNCGIRLPPSAGSASGVLANPVGYNRMYVYMNPDNEGNTATTAEESSFYKKWFSGLNAGQVFVSNGPLLRIRANNQLPGHVFRTGQDSLDLIIQGALDSKDPIDRVEIVRNGEADAIQLPARVTILESGWFLVRAVTTLTNTLRFASTGPFYVELNNNPVAPQQRESSQFFLEWCDERIDLLRANESLEAQKKEEILQPWMEAREFWKDKKQEAPHRVRLKGQVRDAQTGAMLPARIYLQDEEGIWHFVESTGFDQNSSALRYQKRNWLNTNAEEFHTTISAHPFTSQLKPGNYQMIVERGKEYLPHTNSFTLENEEIELEIPLKRWVHMAELGWYSGETHVHRSPSELRNLQLAEDLNVAFPLTYWVAQASRSPSRGDKNLQTNLPEGLVRIDETHVFWPRNTEWEIFSIDSKCHTLGAVFALGHSSVFDLGVPPMGPVARKAEEQGALLDLDKHDWPWAMVLPPVMGVQLYELCNNHMWRTKFSFTNWNSKTPNWMRPPLREQSGNEKEWMLFTMANYYALLNCGINMVPSAGTASGVHPVPLGFSRVYVHLPEGFSYDAWTAGLANGRSFVTTGPMLFVEANGEPPGHAFNKVQPGFRVAVSGTVLSQQPLESIEVIHDGRVVKTIAVRNQKISSGAFETEFQSHLRFPSSGWLAVRAWENREHNRVRFAHTSPWHVHVPGKPLLPRNEERNYLVDRVQEQIKRSGSFLSEPALKEYQRALQYYQELPVRDSASP